MEFAEAEKAVIMLTDEMQVAQLVEYGVLVDLTEDSHAKTVLKFILLKLQKRLFGASG